MFGFVPTVNPDMKQPINGLVGAEFERSDAPSTPYFKVPLELRGNVGFV